MIIRFLASLMPGFHVVIHLQCPIVSHHATMNKTLCITEIIFSISDLGKKIGDEL